ncbi:MAG: RNase P subunit p30 family protein [Candidatus Bathyarchaeia archaeon]
MRRFADLCVRPPEWDLAVQERMAALAREAGLSSVGLRFRSEAQTGQKESTAKIFRDAGLDCAFGVEIAPASRKQLLRQVRTLRERFDFIAVRSSDPATLAAASRDSRVDLVSLELQKSLRVKHSILKACRTALELELSRILRPPAGAVYESLRSLCFEIEMVKRFRTEVVLSSGAAGPLGLRSPRDMAALATLLGLPPEIALDAISTRPLSLIKKGREWLTGRRA